MVLSSKNETEVVCDLPSQVKSLGEALEPVAKRLRRAISCKVRSSGHEFVIFNDLLRHTGVISQALTHLQPRLSDLSSSAIEDERASTAEAYRAAGRLEQVLSEFVDGYHEVKASHADPEARMARTLLLGVYRHHITEICDWLDELVQVIFNPVAAAKKRGIPLTGSIQLSVVLNLTTPPEMAKLNDLAKTLQIGPEPKIEPVHEPQIEPAPEYQRQAGNSPGVMGTIGALAFGIGITEAILGRHRG